MKNDCRIKGKEVKPESFYRTTEVKAGDFGEFFTSIAINVAAVFSDQNYIGKTADGRKKFRTCGRKFLHVRKKISTRVEENFYTCEKKFLHVQKISSARAKNLSMIINKN